MAVSVAITPTICKQIKRETRARLGGSDRLVFRTWRQSYLLIFNIRSTTLDLMLDSAVRSIPAAGVPPPPPSTQQTKDLATTDQNGLPQRFMAFETPP